jgi:hypothetical protein
MLPLLPHDLLLLLSPSLFVVMYLELVDCFILAISDIAQAIQDTPS